MRKKYKVKQSRASNIIELKRIIYLELACLTDLSFFIKLSVPTNQLPEHRMSGVEMER
jgi:hypothetical protein